MLGKQAVNSFGDVLIRGSDWFLEDIYGNYEYEEGEDHIWKGVGDIQEDKPWMILGHTVNEETYRLIHDVGLKGKATPQEERFLEQGIERVEKETAARLWRRLPLPMFLRRWEFLWLECSIWGLSGWLIWDACAIWCSLWL